MSLIIRNSIRVLLINEKKEILLLLADDPKTTSIDGKERGRFWFVIGGEINYDESTEEAAIREIYEETGLKEDEVKLGPIVWFGEYDLILDGKLTHLKQRFMVAKTKIKEVSLTKLDGWEKKVIQKLAWFSIDDIKNSEDIIYPVGIDEYLVDILAEKYPTDPIEIDLDRKPKQQNQR
ncbi:MAG: RNA pyrophosphohydrolase [Candidatus Anoxychlamydiales bacterium]|nr:RNA pyrophosphohydrolase [Candidatus Anoxychlamydiales bacterium]